MTDYYLRTSGDDANDGLSAGNSWATFDHALDSLSAGDTVYIGPGTHYHQGGDRINYGGTSGNSIIFMGDPMGLKTGDPAAPVILTGMVVDFDTPWREELIKWTGDSKFFEFHNIVFMGAAQGITDRMILIGAATGAFGLDGVVFDDCIFMGKGGTTRHEDTILKLDYGDGDTPVGTGVRIRRCLFAGPVEIVCDDNVTATFDIDFQIESCVFAGAAALVVSPGAGTYTITGIRAINCGLIANSNNDNQGTISVVNLEEADSVKIYGCYNAGGAGVVSGAPGGALFATMDHSTSLQNESVDSADSNVTVGDAVPGLGILHPNGAWFGNRANMIYEKYFGMRPYLEWEPIELFGQINAVTGLAHPTEVPTLDYYGRAFDGNRAGSRIHVGFYNGDYATSPYGDVIYTYQDPNSVWTSEVSINENDSQNAYCAVEGSISTNFLHIEKPAVRIHASQTIHDVYIRPMVYFNTTPSPGALIHFNFYTLDEGEDLGEFTVGEDALDRLHFGDFYKIPTKPAGGWTVADVENLECRIWATGTSTNQFQIRMLAIHLDTGQADAGPVQGLGIKEVETTTIHTGTNAMKINRGGAYQTTIPVKDSVEITISVYGHMDANYTGSKPQLEVFNIPGGTVDQTDTMTGAASVWEELSVTFTPAQNGFVTVRLSSRDTSPDGVTYFDNLTHVYGDQPWYMSETAPGTVVDGAWQAKGAATYAASKVNLNSPGILDLLEVVGAVDWTIGAGWDHDEIDFFDTGWIADGSGQTIICRFSDAVSTKPVLGDAGPGGIQIVAVNGTQFLCSNQTTDTPLITVAATTDDVVICMAGASLYIDGVFDSTMPSYTPAAGSVNVFLGGVSGVGGGATIVAAAIYERVLDATEVAAITTKMQAL